MRTTPVLRTCAAALFTGGVLTVAVAGTSTAAAPSNHPASSGSDGPVWGTVVSSGDLNLRQLPTSSSALVGKLPPGSEDRVQCAVKGQSVSGNPYWFWLAGARAWASAAFVDIGDRGVPSCSDPCPGWKDRSGNPSWHCNPAYDPSDDDHASGSGYWSFSASGSWSWSVSVSSSG
ncbi:SH3 domain-containing protein [Streptomyces sp. NPDC005551]|uniref:SH3 domain-containing protein n=1 Tax=unclassified Streptomyces TaxID=2593676 RepID=UPI0033EA8FDE